MKTKLNHLNLFLCLFQLFSSNIWAQIAPGDYTIQSALDPNKNLDVMWGHNENGVGLHLWDATNADAQQFYLQSTNERGFFNILTKWGKAIDVEGFNPNSEAKVVIYNSYRNSDNQKWQFIDAGNGFYYIKSKLGTYLDVQNGNPAAGTAIWMYSFNGSNAQKWKLNAPTNFIVRDKWFLPLKMILQTATVRINNYTSRKNQFNSTGERAYYKPNDNYFALKINDSFIPQTFELDMREAGPNNLCKGYINDWNSEHTRVNLIDNSINVWLRFENQGTEVITDCYNNALCFSNPCPNFELNNAVLRIKITPILSSGRLSYNADSNLNINVQELGNDPCSGNFWAFLCDWGLIPRQGERQNLIRTTIENNVKTHLSRPTVRFAIETALNNTIRDAGYDPAHFKAISINRNGNLLFW